MKVAYKLSLTSTISPFFIAQIRNLSARVTMYFPKYPSLSSFSFCIRLHDIEIESPTAHTRDRERERWAMEARRRTVKNMPMAATAPDPRISPDFGSICTGIGTEIALVRVTSSGTSLLRISLESTEKPVWNSINKEGQLPTVASKTNKLSRNNLVGYCELDLLKFLSQEPEFSIEVLDLLDPSSSDKVVGSISLSCSVEDPIETEKGFARRILAIVVCFELSSDLISSFCAPFHICSVDEFLESPLYDLLLGRNFLKIHWSINDYNEDGMLSFSEFTDLINAFGNQEAANKKEELFRKADKNKDGAVSMDEFADLLAAQQEDTTAAISRQM
ncbi:phosphatidylserine decarboxylase [Asimina triloba]